LVEGMDLGVSGCIAQAPNEIYALGGWLSTTLVRWSGEQGAQTLFADGGDFRQILGGVDRVYLLGDEELSSIPRSGGVISSEGITARTAAVRGSTLYAVDSAGTPYWRDADHDTGTLPLGEPIPTRARSWLSADEYSLALVAESSADAGTYTVYYLPDDHGEELPWVPLTSEVGSPAQVRVGGRAVYVDAILSGDPVSAEPPDVEHELREVKFSGTTRAVLSLTGLLDFEIVGRRLYLSVELPNNRAVLRVVALDDPSEVLDVETSAAMASLTYSGGFFYFGDATRQLLARLPAWLE
jgi:hypothetical protein